VAHEYGASQQRFKGDRREFRVDLSHPAVVFEPGKCIACGICVRIAAEGRDKLGMGFSGSGFDVRAAVPFDGMLGDGLQETALACADACPTGALARTTGSDI
jgi:NADH dehydrogenase/NADH:ubiquinone oxidoreductase subunit G